MTTAPLILAGIGLLFLARTRASSSSGTGATVIDSASGITPGGGPGTVLTEDAPTTFRDLWKGTARKYRRRILAILGSIIALGTTGIVVSAPTVVGGIAIATATLGLCALSMALYSQQLEKQTSGGRGPKRAAEVCRRLASFFLFATDAGTAVAATQDGDELAAAVDAQDSGELTQESTQVVIDSYDAGTVAAVEGMI